MKEFLKRWAFRGCWVLASEACLALVVFSTLGFAFGLAVSVVFAAVDAMYVYFEEMKAQCAVAESELKSEIERVKVLPEYRLARRRGWFVKETLGPMKGEYCLESILNRIALDVKVVEDENVRLKHRVAALENEVIVLKGV